MDRPLPAGAHPRSRGENPFVRDDVRDCGGSSPLTRGKRRRCWFLPTRRWLIPAHAGKTSCRARCAPSSRAHPRSRGENVHAPTSAPSGYGSSPLTRGKPADRALSGKWSGLIPAHAGKTVPTMVTDQAEAAHPRSRGENAPPDGIVDPDAGSSPLTRGKRRLPLSTYQACGLIPAHAGKTGGQGVGLLAARAHPRSRGENAEDRQAALKKMGSSPLTRGKRTSTPAARPSSGLIPAHAGKTSSSRTGSGRCGAHPRSRGENIRGPDAVQAVRGSSPLTRGKPLVQARRIREEGLIPAHSGKTRYRVRPRHRLGAHPRSRGENLDGVGGWVVDAGSSPLTRGKPEAPAEDAVKARLIPAHAGKTMPPRSPRPPARAHPRSRGENHGLVTNAVTWMGSSPLTRGKRCRCPSPARTTGLIPAHAGKTRMGCYRRAHCAAHPRSRGENGWGATQPRALPAHPRSRGENFRFLCVLLLFSGSSPLTRGKPSPTSVQEVHDRLIPAHAGKTASFPARGSNPAAHPRSRGENLPTRSSRLHARGSSPLTRGKPRRSTPGDRTRRLIPAHAGKTRGCASTGHGDSAHPRSRGENGCFVHTKWRVQGSSPLTRGKR